MSRFEICPNSALPASALDEPESDDEEETSGEDRDDERTGTKYNVSLHFIGHGQTESDRFVNGPD